jgi:hypothetical protein
VRRRECRADEKRMEGQVSLSTLLLMFGALGAALFAAFFLWYYRQSGGQRALETSRDDYRSLAESRGAKVDELKGELVEVRAELKTRTAERDAAVRDGNDCAQENLRLWARLGKLERAFNGLERRFQLPETNFEDPGALHMTDSPDRKH